MHWVRVWCDIALFRGLSKPENFGVLLLSLLKKGHIAQMVFIIFIPNKWQTCSKVLTPLTNLFHGDWQLPLEWIYSRKGYEVLRNVLYSASFCDVSNILSFPYGCVLQFLSACYIYMCLFFIIALQLCPSNQVWVNCVPCAWSCSNRDLLLVCRKACPDPGCACPSGTLWNGKHCVPPNSCPSNPGNPGEWSVLVSGVFRKEPLNTSCTLVFAGFVNKTYDG